MILGLGLGLLLGQARLVLEPSGALLPAELPAETTLVSDRSRRQAYKSPWVALGLSAACELPFVGFGPSCGHLYADDLRHFAFTGSLRLLDLATLFTLDRFGQGGTGALYATIQPHASRSLAAYPLAYPVDLVLVGLWVASALYDLIDSPLAAERANQRSAALAGYPSLVRF